ncbi:MAG: NADH-quinone oxidoreductase subunit F [Rhodobacterales bacterium]|nr:MAG: NADH-quinone oxidoreductase subunit F [Rhodobacterales bacterium]
MVSVLYIIAAGLGTAFLIGLLKSSQKGLAFLFTVLALAFMSWVSLDWTVALSQGRALPTNVMTAGFPPPFAINLFIGHGEAWLLTVVNVTGLLSAFYMYGALSRMGRGAMAVLLIIIMALSGLIMTRDVFNLFVFFELIVIATGGLVLLSEDRRAVAAGFKYLVVSQIISILLLIGIIFTYHANGSLNLDDFAARPFAFKGASLAMFLLLMAVVLELKPFPANGWALDIYESAHPGFSAIFSAASGTAALFAVDKIAGAAGPDWLPMLTGLGLLSFLGSNLLALAQDNDRRLLGYSSVGQIGLVLAIVGQRDILGEAYLYVAYGVLITHAVAKAGLFWLSGLVPGRALTDWTVLRSSPLLVFAFASFIAMLVGLPPFPSFYAKWDLIHMLAGQGRYWVIAAVLIGALIEAGYMFRFFGYAMKREMPARFPAFRIDKVGVVLVALASGWILAMVWGGASLNPNLLPVVELGNLLRGDIRPGSDLLFALPFLFALSFLLLEPLPAKVKNAIAIAGLLGWFAFRMAHYDAIQMVFGAIMMVGGAVVLLASFQPRGKRLGFYVPALLMYAGLAILVEAPTSFTFFAAWELLTLGSYYLILRGKEGEPHALSYILFSLGGAFLLLAGFAVASNGVQPFDIRAGLAALAEAGAASAPWVFVLLAVGFMTKTASIGLHVWLPGAHAEAETDVSPMVSGILLKAGLFGLLVLVMSMGRQVLFGIDLTHVLLWIGALSALLGAVGALFQEDAKRLLAYSSISQMGYAVFGLALLSHIGYLLAIMSAINHYVIKSMLFLGIGGVYKRTGTKLMYKMGGIIKVMPLSFVSVLVGIIAMSGVPPLSGFGGRWIFYNGIMESDLRLPMVVVFLSGPISFLYLFRLIHTVFLGQPKPEHSRLKEAPFWIILPQMMFTAFLIGFAILPGMALQKVDHEIGLIFGDSPFTWDGRAITSVYGNWNPVAIMGVIVAIFVSVATVLTLKAWRAQSVKQFNIVFSAERPFRPNTSHFAWNFFAPYRRALGFLEAPLVTRFWESVADSVHATADFGRRIYTGNGQTYAVQLVFFVVAVYLIASGVVS